MMEGKLKSLAIWALLASYRTSFCEETKARTTNNKGTFSIPQLPLVQYHFYGMQLHTPRYSSIQCEVCYGPHDLQDSSFGIPFLNRTYVWNTEYGGECHQFHVMQDNGSTFLHYSHMLFSRTTPAVVHFPAVYGFYEQLNIVVTSIFRSPFFMDCKKPSRNMTCVR